MDEFAVSVPHLDLALDQLAGRRPVIVSLAEVSILTSAGIQTLLRERDYGRPVVFCPAGNLSRILEAAQAHNRVPIYRHLDAALADLGTPGHGRRAFG